ncbi:MAG: 50S ribosomal protein L29 [Candidatus Aenigmatarchaeota archaeon]
MAILKYKDIKKLGAKELEAKLAEFEMELAKERANIAVGASVSSPGKIKEIRKTIARIKMHMSQQRHA